MRTVKTQEKITLNEKPNWALMLKENNINESDLSTISCMFENI